MKRAAILLAALAILGLAPHAQAQLFRTYLSVGGSDTNPCTLQLPCRLLPAALAAVSDGGEVWIVDSGNFNVGTVNVNKSVSIIAVPGQVGSVVALGGGPAISVAFSGIKVALRNLVIGNNAQSPGLDGVDITGGSVVSVEDCLFQNLPSIGIKANDSSVDLHVKNSVFRNMGYAVWAQNGPTVNVVGSQFFNTNGVIAYGDIGPSTTVMSVSDSVIAGGIEGAFVKTTANGATATLAVARTIIHNVYYAIDSETNGSGFAVLTLSDSAVSGNSYGFYQVGAGSSVQSLGNNQISDNSLGDVGGLTPVALR